MKRQLVKHIRMCVALAAVAAVAGYIVYAMAMTPAELAAFKRSAKPVDWDAVRADPDKRLSVRILLPSGNDDSWMERFFEERFNLDIEPVFLGAAAQAYAKPLMMAGGDIPDVLVEHDPIMVQRDAYHGFLLPIPPEVIVEHAPNYVKAVNETDPIGWLYGNWNGVNYGIPRIYVSLRWSVPGVWRKDWLRNVGIEKTPETLEEMHEALRRFTFDDPDGNGEDDTWGMSGDVNHWWWASFADIFGAYGVLPYDWMERDGKAAWGGTLPETKEALATLNAWYREGIIHKDFVTDKSRETLHRKFYNGVTGYLYYQCKYRDFDPEATGSLANKLKGLNPEAEICPGRFPIGPTGKRGGRVWSGGHTLAFGGQIAERPEVVIRVLRILEAMVTDEQLYLKTRLGERGVHWDYNDPAVGPASGVGPIGKYRDQNHARRALLGSIETSEIIPGCGPAELVDKYTRRAELAFNWEYRHPKWALRDALGKPDCVPSAAEYLGDLRNYQMTVFAEIIRGDKPLDYFDTFVKNWYERGGRTMTEEATGLLKAKKEIYRRVGVTE
jgi:putative aldouronate transport system substrate-binding protein